MKTILETNTGKVLFAVVDDYELQDNQISIESLLTESFVNPFWNFETQVFYEGATTQEINDIRIPQALEIDLYYTGLISDLLRKHVEKKILRGIDIPQAVEEEVNRLRAECNQKIMDLGITNFAYRQSNLRL
jgi:hypothetical protein